MISLSGNDGWWLKRSGEGIAIRTNLFPSSAGADGKTSFRPFVDRLHGMGLKAGIYSDIGRNNCSQHWDKTSPNLPEGSVEEREVGAMGHYAQDAALFFAEWGFDFIKVDACGVADYGPQSADVRAGLYRAQEPLILRDKPQASKTRELIALYAAFSDAIKATGSKPQPILAICAWGEADVNNWAGKYGQMWRTSGDIRATWASMLHNFDSAAPRSLFAGPGRWNDPDLLEIGNGEFDAGHLVEARTHMSLWAIIAAPLFLSYDLAKAPAAIHEIAGNGNVIAINQDPAGNQGVILSLDGDRQVIVKQLAQRGDKALALTNRGKQPSQISVSLADLHLDARARLKVRDVWTGRDVSVDGGIITASLAPHETALFRLTGTPAEPAIVRPSEIPAKITVLKDGWMPENRRTRDQWIPARIGFYPDGKPIFSGKARDLEAIGVATGSALHIDAAAGYARLRVSPHGSSARQSFSIFGDGKLLKRGVADGRAITVPIQGIRALTMEVDAGDAPGGFSWGGFQLQK